MDAVQVVTEALAAYASGGIAALIRFYHPEAEIVGGPYFGPKGTYTGGPNAVRAIVSEVDRQYEGLKAKPTDVRAGGTPDRVLVEAIVTYGSSGTSPGGAWRSWWAINVRDGKIARLEVFHDEADALEAAGLLHG